MRQILVAVAIALTTSILLTPVLIRLFTRQGFGHEIREDGPPSHHKKRGTPSMGGVAIVAGIWASYFGTHLVGLVIDGKGPSASGLLVLRPMENPAACWDSPRQLDRRSIHQTSAIIRPNVLAMSAL